MGKIVVIEGTDYSGKTTQYEMLRARLEKEGRKVGNESFPVYGDESSIFVRRYLQEEYGKEAKEINSRLASLFYGLDRYDSYKRGEWGEIYDTGGDILFARYTTSNILHQTSKIKTKEGCKEYIEWLEDMEYNIMGIPRPDLVILLDMPPRQREKLKQKRDKELGGKASSGGTKDIHEKDSKHLDESYAVAKEVAKELGWYILECEDSKGRLRTEEDIHEEIYRVTVGKLDKR